MRISPDLNEKNRRLLWKQRLAGKKSAGTNGYALLSRKLQIVAVFCLAGLLSAWAFNAYAAWVDTLYSAVPRQMSDDGLVTSESFDKWYRANTALGPYADRKWTILCLGFPIAMSVAMFVTSKAGWLGYFGTEKKIAGLIPVYFAPGMVLYLSGVSWFLLLIPALAIAACVLSFSLKTITSKWSAKLFLGFLLGVAAFVVLWFNVGSHGQGGKASEDAAWNVAFTFLEMIWGGLYGLGLTVPGRAMPPPRPPVLDSRVVRS
jgi:hypothetical protein